MFGRTSAPRFSLAPADACAALIPGPGTYFVEDTINAPLAKHRPSATTHHPSAHNSTITTESNSTVAESSATDFSISISGVTDSQAPIAEFDLILCELHDGNNLNQSIISTAQPSNSTNHTPRKSTNTDPALHPSYKKRACGCGKHREVEPTPTHDHSFLSPHSKVHQVAGRMSRMSSSAGKPPTAPVSGSRTPRLSTSSSSNDLNTSRSSINRMEISLLKLNDVFATLFHDKTALNVALTQKPECLVSIDSSLTEMKKEIEKVKCSKRKRRLFPSTTPSTAPQIAAATETNTPEDPSSWTSERSSIDETFADAEVILNDDGFQSASRRPSFMANDSEAMMEMYKLKIEELTRAKVEAEQRASSASNKIQRQQAQILELQSQLEAHTRPTFSTSETQTTSTSPISRRTLSDSPLTSSNIKSRIIHELEEQIATLTESKSILQQQLDQVNSNPTNLNLSLNAEQINAEERLKFVTERLVEMTIRLEEEQLKHAAEKQELESHFNILCTEVQTTATAATIKLQDLEKEIWSKEHEKDELVGQIESLKTEAANFTANDAKAFLEVRRTVTALQQEIMFVAENYEDQLAQLKKQLTKATEAQAEVKECYQKLEKEYSEMKSSKPIEPITSKSETIVEEPSELEELRQAKIALESRVLRLQSELSSAKETRTVSEVLIQDENSFLDSSNLDTPLSPLTSAAPARKSLGGQQPTPTKKSHQRSLSFSRNGSNIPLQSITGLLSPKRVPLREL